jgi:hypothetical protein
MSTNEEIEDIFIKLIKEVEKEENDIYPYNIKNSTLKMNFIRKNHKNFNFIFICILGVLIVSLSYKFLNFSY